MIFKYPEETRAIALPSQYLLHLSTICLLGTAGKLPNKYGSKGPEVTLNFLCLHTQSTFSRVFLLKSLLGYIHVAVEGP